jgi:hypothetical protein
MSIDIEITVIGKTEKEVLDVVKKYRLGTMTTEENSENQYYAFYVAGLPFSISESDEGVVLNSTTNMGWSYYGETRDMQKPIAEMLAQYFALYLNCETSVYDPQSGDRVFYRRKEHPEIHAVLEGKNQGFRAEDYENFCETRKDKNGNWEQMGWRAKARKKCKND